MISPNGDGRLLESYDNRQFPNNPPSSFVSSPADRLEVDAFPNIQDLTETGQAEPPAAKENDIVDVPTMDVGEHEEDVLRSQDETLLPEEPQNLAYSYSNYVPKYQHPPANYFALTDTKLGGQQVAPMSFVFHPRILQTEPNLVLQGLRSFAVQLQNSPIMNALFSPANVPVPQTLPNWPSKYDAQKYLPPSQANLAQPYTRRAILQVNGVTKLQNPDETAMAGKLFEESYKNNANAISNLMQQNMNFPSQQANQFFATGANAMNSFFNQQFKNFPSFKGGRFQQGGKKIYKAPRPVVIKTPLFVKPQKPKLQTPKVPYISPSLRPSFAFKDPSDDIDVRMNSKSDVIQIGRWNKNFIEGPFHLRDEDLLESTYDSGNDPDRNGVDDYEEGGNVDALPVVEQEEEMEPIVNPSNPQDEKMEDMRKANEEDLSSNDMNNGLEIMNQVMENAKLISNVTAESTTKPKQTSIETTEVDVTEITTEFNATADSSTAVIPEENATTRELQTDETTTEFSYRVTTEPFEELV